MRYLLDTNVVSELRKRPDRVDHRVAGWADQQPSDDLAISVITLMELEVGVARIERRDPIAGVGLRRWFENKVVEGFDQRLLTVSTAVARRAAVLHVPDPVPLADGLIAATALVHGLTVVTRNTKDFDRTGVPLINPWQY